MIDHDFNTVEGFLVASSGWLSCIQWN